MSSIAEGDNYEISMDEHGVVVCRVWRRPDLDHDAGARCAEEMLERIRDLALSSEATGFVYDLREAPPVAGPRTQAAIVGIVALWVEGGRRVAIAVGDASLRKLQMQRLVSEAATQEAAVFDEPDEALRWVRKPDRQPSMS